MVSRQAILDEIQELRMLVCRNEFDQVLLHVRLLVRTCDRLTEPIHSPPKRAGYDSPIYPADYIGLSVPLLRSLGGYIAEAGFVVESDPRRALKALDEAVLALEERGAKGE
jgi:hypothetical protein